MLGDRLLGGRNSFITSLLHYRTAALLHCCTAALLHCCTTALLHCCTAALLHCCTATLLHCCTAALLHYCFTTPLRCIATLHTQHVTILFADIVGWTRISETVSTYETFSLLNRLFHAFDELTEEYGVFKVGPKSYPPHRPHSTPLDLFFNPISPHAVSTSPAPPHPFHSIPPRLRLLVTRTWWLRGMTDRMTMR